MTILLPTHSPHSFGEFYDLGDFDHYLTNMNQKAPEESIAEQNTKQKSNNSPNNPHPGNSVLG